jgi:Tol biopolymer transport system component
VLAVGVGAADGTRDLWLKDLVTGALQRLTSTPGSDTQPVWSPDSRYLAFSSARVGVAYTEVGSGRVLPVSSANGLSVLHSWTPDGKYLLVGSSTNVSLIEAPSASPGSPAESAPSAPQGLFDATYATDHFRVSPDGKWVAYTSRESGRDEVSVAAFPSFASRRPVSLEGGTQPQWRPDNQELFFHAAGERLMAVDVASGETLTVGTPRELFRTNPLVTSTTAFQYAATPDGQRFLLLEPIEGAVTTDEPLFLLTNWTALLDAN